MALRGPEFNPRQIGLTIVMVGILMATNGYKLIDSNDPVVSNLGFSSTIVGLFVASFGAGLALSGR